MKSHVTHQEIATRCPLQALKWPKRGDVMMAYMVEAAVDSAEASSNAATTNCCFSFNLFRMTEKHPGAKCSN